MTFARQWGLRAGLLCCLCLLGGWAGLAQAAAYLFASSGASMPKGCSYGGYSGGVFNFSCGAVTLAWNDTVSIKADSRPARISFTGAFDASNAVINGGGSADQLTLVVGGNFTTQGSLVAQLQVSGSRTAIFNSGSSITGSITMGTGTLTLASSNVTVDGSITSSGALLVGAAARINGPVSAASVTDTSSSAVYGSSITASNGAVSLGYGASVAGDIRAEGGSGSVTLAGGNNVGGLISTSGTFTLLGSSSTIAGSIKAAVVMALGASGSSIGGGVEATAGAINLGGSSLTVGGDAVATGIISLGYNTRVHGCARTTRTSMWSIQLNGWQSGAGGVCCLSGGGSCLPLENACYSNSSGSSLALCKTTLAPVLGKVASTASAVVGDVVSFTLSVSNPNDEPMADLVLTDVMPAGMAYVNHVAQQGSVVASGQTVTWTLPALAGKASAQMTLVVRLNQQGSLTNTFSSPGAISVSRSILVLSQATTHFRMDEVEGSWNGADGEVVDSGGTALHGRRMATTASTGTNVVTPDPTIESQFASVDGSFCNAGSFDGGGVVMVPGDSRFDYSTKLSATAWIYPTARPSSDLYSILSNDKNYEFHINPSGKLYWWWNSSSLTSASTIPLNQWTHVAITFDSVSGRQYIYINGVRDGNSGSWKGTLQPNGCNFYIGGDVSTSASCPFMPARNFRGKIDEVKLYNYELSQAEVQADMTLGRSCSGAFDHLRVIHDGTASICNPESVEVLACLDVDCTKLYPGTVTARLTPGGSTFTFSGGATSTQISSATPGNVAIGYNSINPAPTNGLRCFNGATENCTMNFASASCSFDAVEKAAASQAPIYTKLSGSLFELDVLALSGGAVVNAAYTGTVAVDLVDASSSSCPTGAGLSTAQDLVFAAADKGRKNVSFTYAAAAKNVRVRMKVGSSAPSCSYDNFAIRPKQLTVSAPLMNNTVGTGTPAAVAGTDFTLDAQSGVLSGYDGTPVIKADKVEAAAGDPIHSGTLSGAFNAATGSKASGTFQYRDVGNIRFPENAVVDESFTAVDQGKAVPDCVVGSADNSQSGGRYGCNISNQKVSIVGRWYPSHFSFAGTLTPGCAAGGFTYMGDDSLQVSLAIKAHAKGSGAASASDPVTARYKAGSVSVTASNAGVAVPPRLDQPDLPAMPDKNLWSAGVWTLEDTYRFTKAGPPDGPFDDYRLKVEVVDGDGAKLLVSTPAQVTDDATNSTMIRHGRLWAANAYGSEYLPLPVPAQVQYWSATGWTRNLLDSCTLLTLPTVANEGLDFKTQGARNQLAAGETLATLQGSNGATQQVVKGDAGLRLSAPGAGNYGYLDIPLGILRGGNGWLDLAVPTVRACFGVCGPRSPVIFRRELR